MAPLHAQHVLVTGASGFIGRAVVRRLAETGSQVSCLVRAGSQVEALRAVGATLWLAEITDHEGVTRALEASRPDVVIHLAGRVRAKSRRAFEEVNAGGVEVVARACATLDQPPVLVVVSSLAAAGPCCAGQPRVESDPPQPVSNYGHSKLAGEQAAIDHADRVPVTIVRPPVVFGPEDVGVLELLRPIARLGLHLVPGRGQQQLSLIHVDDLVEGLLAAAERGERVQTHAAPGTGIYFLAGDESPTLVELGQVMAEALDCKRVRTARVPGPLLRTAGILGDVLSRVRRRRSWINSDKVTEALAGSWMCSSAKAREQLRWTPAKPLEERLRETVQWYREATWL